MDIPTLKRILALLLCLLALAGCALAEEYAAHTAVDGAKVYDAEGKALGTLPANTALTVTGVKDGVCRVTRDGRTAYMKKSDLALDDKSQASEQTPARQVAAYVKSDGARLYTAEKKSAGTLALNTAVTVTGIKDGVCRVLVNGGEYYMRASDLSDKKSDKKNEETSRSATAYAAAEGVKVYNASGDPVATLGMNAQVTVTAVKGDYCRVERDGATGYMRRSDLSAEKVKVTGDSGTLKAATGTAVEMDWWDSDIQTIFARGVVAQITDVETGLTWREQRRGGTNHADCQPLTAADTAALKKAYGGTWSWNRRAIFVTIDGVNYAASMNGMPHGSGSIEDNGFNGHHCIHFTNSRTHGSNKVCPLHQAAIKKAASTRLK